MTARPAALLLLFLCGGLLTACFTPRLRVHHDDPTTSMLEVWLDDEVLGTVEYGEAASFEVAAGLHSLELCPVDGGERRWPQSDEAEQLTIENDLELRVFPATELPAGAQAPHG
jgi:hypothetical protein